MVVANRVTGDSRVQRMATTAAQAGFDVTVLGLAHRTNLRFEALGDVLVHRLASSFVAHAGGSRSLRDARRREREADRAAARRALAAARHRERALLASSSDGPARFALSAYSGVALRLQRAGATAAERLGARSVARTSLAVDLTRARFSPANSWRRLWPLYVDYQTLFADALVELRPDLVHVHDVHPLPAADLAARLLTAEGHAVRWLYDAHEDVAGQQLPDPRQRLANEGVEVAYAPRADAVVTVSAQLAARLVERLDLRSVPEVVANAPSVERLPDPSGERRTVREEVGLPPGTPLLVYSGALAERRGVTTLVDALVELPGVHVAVVGFPGAAHGAQLQDRAARLGVADRVHLRPYVAAESVTWYLSTATAGVAPFLPTPSHGVALATKLREYLHAGLPLLVSDVGTMAEFVRSTGTGTVFRAGAPADLARAARQLLAGVEEHRRAITDELLQEHSWEAQAGRLVGLWRSLLPPEAPAPVPRRSRRPDEPVVVIGPLGQDHQGERWASALREAAAGRLETRVVTRGSGAEERPDERVGALARGQQAYRTVVEGTHLLAESLQPLFGPLFAGDPVRELLHLLSRGTGVAVVCHGADVRDARAHAEREPLSPHRQSSAEQLAKLDRQARRNRERLAPLEVPVLVVAPDVLDDVPGSVWLPVTVDEGWLEGAPCPPPRSGRRPVVTQLAPTRAGADGADPVLAALEPLHASGRIELRPYGWARAHGRKRAVTESDVLVDDLGTGSYGLAACEAMAAGRVVVSHVAEAVRTRTGGRLPVVEAEASGLADVVEDLLLGTDRAQRIAEEGRAYVREVHGGALAARVIADVLGLGLAAAGGPTRVAGASR